MCCWSSRPLFVILFVEVQSFVKLINNSHSPTVYSNELKRFPRQHLSLIYGEKTSLAIFAPFQLKKNDQISTASYCYTKHLQYFLPYLDERIYVIYWPD